MFYSHFSQKIGGEFIKKKQAQLIYFFIKPISISILMIDWYLELRKSTIYYNLSKQSLINYFQHVKCN